MLSLNLIIIIGGIRFELRDTQDYRLPSATTPNEPPTSVIYLKVRFQLFYSFLRLLLMYIQSVPLSFHDMFNQYFQMANRIRKHYLSPRVLICLLTGQFVPPLNRRNLYSLQYSMLPARRATVSEMWRAMNTSIPQKKPFQLPNIPPLANSGRRGAGNTKGRLHH